jgi:hypothetical protein
MSCPATLRPGLSPAIHPHQTRPADYLRTRSGRELEEALITGCAAELAMRPSPSINTPHRSHDGPTTCATPRYLPSRTGVRPTRVTEWAGHSVAVPQIYAECLAGQEAIAWTQIEAGPEANSGTYRSRILVLTPPPWWVSSGFRPSSHGATLPPNGWLEKTPGQSRLR